MPLDLGVGQVAKYKSAERGQALKNERRTMVLSAAHSMGVLGPGEAVITHGKPSKPRTVAGQGSPPVTS